LGQGVRHEARKEKKKKPLPPKHKLKSKPFETSFHLAARKKQITGKRKKSLFNGRKKCVDDGFDKWLKLLDMNQSEPNIWRQSRLLELGRAGASKVRRGLSPALEEEDDDSIQRLNKQSRRQMFPNRGPDFVRMQTRDGRQAILIKSCIMFLIRAFLQTFQAVSGYFFLFNMYIGRIA
jgi:hypothetical protein